LGRLKKFNEEQIDLVTEILRYVRDNSSGHGTDAGKALDRYWETPEAKKKTIVCLP
jgi:hypothetical protein